MDKEVLDFQKTVINGLKEQQMMGGMEQSICQICMNSITMKN